MAVMAPQSEWPQTTTSVTPSTATAYSTVAVTPPGSELYDGTMLPALRITKMSPGFCCVSSSGTTRLSEQVINRVLGFCVVASCLNSLDRPGKVCCWNFSAPETMDFMVNSWCVWVSESILGWANYSVQD